MERWKPGRCEMGQPWLKRHVRAEVADRRDTVLRVSSSEKQLQGQSSSHSSWDRYSLLAGRWARLALTRVYTGKIKEGGSGSSQIGCLWAWTRFQGCCHSQVGPLCKLPSQAGHLRSRSGETGGCSLKSAYPAHLDEDLQINQWFVCFFGFFFCLLSSVPKESPLDNWV